MPLHGMVITVGIGRERVDIAHAINYSISVHHPDCILFLTTDKSGKETLPYIRNSLACVGKDLKEVLDLEFQDVEKLIFQYRQAISEWMREKILSPENIIADYTSGTKAMSAALTYVSLLLELNSLSYITVIPSKDGKPQPGTERVVSFSPFIIQYEKVLDKIPEQFNQTQFNSCLSLLGTIPDYCSELIRNKRDFFIGLSETYRLWDGFQLKAALDKLKIIKENPLAIELGIKKQMDKNCQFLSMELQLIKINLDGMEEKNLPVELLYDLLENARRRLEIEGKHDDALGRIYRGFEYLSQWKLFSDHQGIDTGDLDLGKLPENLRGLYSQDNPSQKIQLSQHRSYELLQQLNDPLGQRFLDEYHGETAELGKLLSQRNNSILAHGFEPIRRKSTECLFQILENYIKTYIPAQRLTPADACFPKIRMKV